MGNERKIENPFVFSEKIPVALRGFVFDALLILFRRVLLVFLKRNEVLLETHVIT